MLARLERLSSLTSSTSAGSCPDLTPPGHLDLVDVAFGAGASRQLRREPGGGLAERWSVTDGIHTANVALLGQYSADGFTAEADATSGTLLSYKDHLVI